MVTFQILPLKNGKIALKKKRNSLPVFGMQIHEACQFNTMNSWPGLYVLA
jgi:hypothetical protein